MLHVQYAPVAGLVYTLVGIALFLVGSIAWLMWDMYAVNRRMFGHELL